jgi:hypothetical protein
LPDDAPGGGKGGIAAEIKGSKHKNLILIGLSLAAVIIAYLTYTRMKAGSSSTTSTGTTTAGTSSGDGGGGAGPSGSQGATGATGATGAAGSTANTTWLQKLLNSDTTAIQTNDKEIGKLNAEVAALQHPPAKKTVKKPAVKAPAKTTAKPKTGTAKTTGKQTKPPTTHGPTPAMTTHPGGPAKPVVTKRAS